jgi:hypothetical protein
LALYAADVGYVPAVDSDLLISGLDTSLLARALGIDTLGSQMAAILDPPDAIIGSNNFPFFLEIDPGKDDGGNAEQRQKESEEPGL